MQASSKLAPVLSILEDSKLSISLVFVTRHLKDGVPRSAKTIDKYCFKTWEVDISPDLVKFFKDISIGKVKGIVTSDKYELEPYSPISDDLPNKLYSYALNNALSFSDVVINQLNNNMSGTVTSLNQIKGGLWAYVLKVAAPKGTASIFRKISQGKVVTDETQTIGEKISSWFDTSNAELKVVKQESISFDDKVDCVYVDGEFLVFKKSGFESIIGLEEEFKDAAGEVLAVIRATGLVEGIDIVESQLSESKQLLKTLANIGRSGSHQALDLGEIQKMKEALKRFEQKDLKLTPDGKLLLEDKDDVKHFIKLLNDYYKQGVVSGKFYGTSAGQLIEPHI